MHPTRGHLTLAALATLGLASTVALSACGASSTPAGTSMGGMASHDAMTSTAPMSGSRAGDVMFAQMMIPHHQQAIEMADLALKNTSTSAAVRSLATQIKGAQAPEIATMTGWLTSWGASTTSSMDMGTGMMTAQDMASLKAATGPAFDKTWLTLMIKHHEGAITMAKDVAATTSDTAVKALATAIVDGQQKEITTMTGLLG